MSRQHPIVQECNATYNRLKILNAQNLFPKPEVTSVLQVCNKSDRKQIYPDSKKSVVDRHVFLTKSTKAWGEKN